VVVQVVEVQATQVKVAVVQAVFYQALQHFIIQLHIQ
jgi:hypothetical protein